MSAAGPSRSERRVGRILGDGRHAPGTASKNGPPPLSPTHPALFDEKSGGASWLRRQPAQWALPPRDYYEEDACEQFSSTRTRSLLVLLRLCCSLRRTRANGRRSCGRSAISSLRAPVRSPDRAQRNADNGAGVREKSRISLRSSGLPCRIPARRGFGGQKSGVGLRDRQQVLVEIIGVVLGADRLEHGLAPCASA